MPETCACCRGAGTVTAAENFLFAIRVIGRDYRFVGATSMAMLHNAIHGTDNPVPFGGPGDGWDLGRCMVMRAVAPPELHPAMDRMIRRWVRQMNKSKREHGHPYYGVPEARQMLAEEEAGVREDVDRALGRVPSTSKENAPGSGRVPTKEET